MSAAQTREATAREAAAAVEAYSSPLEHLADRLRRFDLLVRREMARALPAAAEHRPRADTPHEAIAEVDRRMQRRLQASFATRRRLPLVELARIFALSEAELDILVACLAGELDRKYEAAFASLHDDMTRKLPSAGLLLSLVFTDAEEQAAARSEIFGPRAPLLRYQLVHVVDDASSTPSSGRGLRLDERIAAFLLGDRSVDGRISEIVDPPSASAEAACLSADQRARLQSLVGAAALCIASHEPHAVRPKPVFYLHGSAHAGPAVLAEEAARQLGLPLLAADAEQLAAHPAGFQQAVFLLLRECLLTQAAACIRNVDRLLGEDRAGQHAGFLFRRLAEMGGVTFLCGERAWSWALPPEPLALLPFELRPAGYAERLAAWRELAAREASAIGDEALHELASKHALPPAELAGVFRLARTYAALRAPGAPISAEDLAQVCRSRSTPNLGGTARRIEPKHDWDDLVLPAGQLEQLHAICSQARRRSRVMGEWGFERKLSLGKGLNALFTGSPGTGKTMAAEVIAHELDLGLYKIDLSQMVSKYIGETEKNLGRLFDQASAGHAILFFDEADALLGKRSEVRDAHDRYANTEVAYLLQKIEEYEGITILATNLRHNMDEAFTRRMGFIVEFPAPEEGERLRIWRRAWPPETPLAPQVDFHWLARQYRVPGGSIRNIALASSFIAAEEGGEVSMRHVVQAAKRELQKMGRLVLDGEERKPAAPPGSQARGAA